MSRLSKTPKTYLFAVVVVMLLVFSLGSLRPASAQAGATATVATGALNVRSGPGVAYGVVTSLYRGTVVSLLSRSADSAWLKVALWNGTQGWVSARFMATTYPIYSLPVEGGTVPQPSGPSGSVATGALNIRSGPGVGYGVLLSVYRGTPVSLISRTYDSSWLKVTASGVTGWVNARYIYTTYPVGSLPVEGGAVPQPPPSNVRYHVVQPGENLFRIALRYGVNMYTLAAVNGIYDVSRIYVGQVLYIP